MITKAYNRPPEPMTFWNGTPCMPWPGGRNRFGYGRVQIGAKRVRAHRAVYENVKGAIPAGLVIDHLCRNTCCVNPDHMEAVTQKVNTVRGIGPSGVNARRTHCVIGHPLTPENTKRNKDRKGRIHRRCRICLRAASNQWSRDKRAKASAQAARP